MDVTPLFPFRRYHATVRGGYVRPFVGDLQQACDPTIRALRDASPGHVGAQRLGLRRAERRGWDGGRLLQGSSIDHVEQGVNIGKRDDQHAIVHPAGPRGGVHCDGTVKRLRVGRSKLRERDRHQETASRVVRQPSWPMLRPGLRGGGHEGSHESDRRQGVTDQRLLVGQTENTAVPRQRRVALRQPRRGWQRVAEQIAHGTAGDLVQGHVELPGEHETRDIRTGHRFRAHEQQKLQASGVARELGHQAGVQDRVRRRQTIDLIRKRDQTAQRGDCGQQRACQ